MKVIFDLIVVYALCLIIPFNFSSDVAKAANAPSSLLGHKSKINYYEISVICCDHIKSL